MEIDRNLSHFCKNSEEYQTWEYLSTLPSTSIYSADTSPDGRWLALGKYNTVEVWNISTMTLYYSFALAADANLHISFSPDGKYLGISSGKVIRYIINTTTWQNIDIGNWDTSASITCFDWSRDSEYLFINSYLTYLYKYYMNGTYQCHFYNSNQINSIDCSPDGNFVATGSYIYLRIHRTNDLEKINEKETAQIINAISYSPDGSRIAAGCNGGYVYCWNTSNFAEPVNRNLGGSPITAISWLPGLQPVIIAGCSNGTLLFLEPVTLNIVKVLKYAGTTTQINTIAYCPYNSKLYTGVYNAAGIVWGKKFNTTLVSPEAGQLLGVDSPLIFRFSEPMNQSTFNMSLFIHPAVNFTWNYNENERMLSIYPQPRFEFNTTYNITFTSALKTLDGIS
ncbi:MAG: Ig-like domain-containing protein, partial [Thermoplasmata archaeon]